MITQQMEKLNEYIDSIALIINYWMPGFIAILILCALTGHKLTETRNTTLVAVVISVIVKTGIVDHLSFLSSNDASLAATCVICILGSIIICLCYRCNKINSIISRVFIKSMHNNMWEDLIDFKNGTALALKLNDGCELIGGYELVEENGEKSWLVLDAYEMCDEDGNVLFDYMSYGKESRMAIRVSDIKTIQTIVNMEAE